ncbi:MULTISPECIES: FAD-dependent oxidoreductase [Myxococcaceae]|uniref:FAD-dependent oxidoreductase n=1 Tax=Myxococcaceae TaxID=31 RepID=UPI00129D1FF4|nr:MULTISPECIES: FAD-dependent oxidoreductase [Myxococcaceae]MBF5045162.1 FAD-dependent oxidoreductase [Simulacricoccus sp. 17bor-14]
MELSRRELLAAFLGSAVAAQACRRPEASGAPVPGALVDRAVQSGHRLRAGGPLPRAAEAERVDVLVVGAGIAGLSAAWRLAGAGVTDFRVLELDAKAGGTARSGRSAVSAYPWGAHYLPAPLESSGPVVRLLRELGAVVGEDARGRPEYAEALRVQEPEERLFYRGSWYEGLYLRAGASPEDLRQLARFEARMARFAAARDAKGRRAFTVPVGACSDDAEWTQLDRLSMAAWLAQEGFTSPRLRWLVDYACRDDYGAEAAFTSAWAGIWYFAARQDGESQQSGAEGFLTWPEGNGHLVAALRAAAGAQRVRTGVLVHTVEPEGEGWRVHGLEGDTPRAWHARQVVFAGPRYVAQHVVAPWRAERPAWADAFAYSPWVVANLHLHRKPAGRGFPLAWDNVLYESRSLGYVVATHQRLQAVDVGPTVLTWYLPLSGEDVKGERARMLSAGYAEYERLVMADLAVAHPGVREDAERLEVMRWGHAMVRPRVGFLWGGAREAAGRSLSAGAGPSLHFAHSDLGGLALFEEAQWHGVRAAEAALAGLGRAPSGSSWL